MCLFVLRRDGDGIGEGVGHTRHEDNKSPHSTLIQIQNPEEGVMRITSDELKQGVDFEANFKQRKLL